jgi:hypothetical protein
MATTVGNLHSVLSRYIPRDDDFAAYLNQLGPRLYALGNWRGTVHEEEIVTDHPYVALPRGYDNLLAGVVDDYPVVSSSRWQDYRNLGMVGTSRGPSLYFGLVDDGLRPTMIELSDGDATANGDYNFRIQPMAAGQSTLPSVGSVIIEWEKADGTLSLTEYALNGAASITSAFTSGNGATRILQITFLDVPQLIKVSAVPVTAGTTFKVAEGRLDEVAEYRRFRLENSSLNRTVAMLMKRRWLNVKYATDVVHLADLNVIKHGLLGITAEDNSDLEAAEYHWNICNRLLEAEMAQYRGAVRPRINFDPSGTGAPATVSFM